MRTCVCVCFPYYQSLNNGQSETLIIQIPIGIIFFWAATHKNPQE